MTTRSTLAAALLASSALIGMPVLAQTAPPAPPSSPSASTVANPSEGEDAELTGDAAEPGADDTPEIGANEDVEISGPGASTRDGDEIVVVGRNIPDPVRATPEVVSILSAQDIARTGEGDIAGALQRVTGLAVVGGRFVYVRGLGERYSLALLNGSPLPSPEPLRRVVPLDLFPTSIIASTVVQKSYSANYPAEFGGGVINLTTRSSPDEPFLEVGAGVGGDSITTGNLGYTYYGGDYDFTGFDDGTRDVPDALASAIASGNRIVEGASFDRAQIQQITSSLANASTTLIQRNNEIPFNYSFDAGAGHRFGVGALDIGIIGVGGLSNSWATRGGLQQAGTRTGTPGSDDEALVASSDFDYLSTVNRAVVNGMGSLTVGLDRHKLRLTSLFIRDTLKEARISSGNNFDTVSPSDLRPDGTINDGLTSWYERQLFDTQAVAELEFGDLSIDLRGSYAKTKRDAPYERSYSYVFNDEIEDYVNDLRSPGQNASISFSNLDDKLWYGAVDGAYRLRTAWPVTLSAGYAHTHNDRSAIRRDFEYFPTSALGLAVAQERIDYLLSDYNVYTYNILLRETTGGLGSAAYDAALTIDAGYLMAEIEPLPELSFNLGVRYETADQSVTPGVLFGLEPAAATQLERSYLLPAGTVTWNFAPNMQLRAAASKTIARPQFRELAPQPYRDTDSQRTFFGNQYLVDSEITNLDARYEYYFGRDQILSLAAFYKDIENPIETTAVNLGSSLISSFANAPRAQLYGAEAEVRKYWQLADFGFAGPFFASRRLATIANYTFTDSEIQIDEGDTTISFTSQPNEIDASLVFDTTRKLRLTGQSKHLLNLQLSLEDTERLSQQSILLSYASPRATARGPNLTPDFLERPGVQLDIVLRQGFRMPVVGRQFELKAEARNLLGTDYEEVQELNGSELIINGYRRGTSFALSGTVKL